jgi:hypothetical protein
MPAAAVCMCLCVVYLRDAITCTSYRRGSPGGTAALLYINTSPPGHKPAPHPAPLPTPPRPALPLSTSRLSSPPAPSPAAAPAFLDVVQ